MAAVQPDDELPWRYPSSGSAIPQHYSDSLMENLRLQVNTDFNTPRFEGSVDTFLNQARILDDGEAAVRHIKQMLDELYYDHRVGPWMGDLYQCMAEIGRSPRCYDSTLVFVLIRYANYLRGSKRREALREAFDLAVEAMGVADKTGDYSDRAAAYLATALLYLDSRQYQQAVDLILHVNAHVTLADLESELEHELFGQLKLTEARLYASLGQYFEANSNAAWSEALQAYEAIGKGHRLDSVIQALGL